MGARSACSAGAGGGEPVADIEVRPAELVATEVEPELVPSLIDELPLVVLVAAFARGTTVIRGAAELRVKEATASQPWSRRCTTAAHVRELEDGFEVTGVPHRLRGGRIDAAGDHRIAMLGAVIGVCSQEGVTIEGAEAMDVSFPDFADRLASVSA